MGVHIHPQAIVSPEAKLGAEVRVGAFAIVAAGVELGDGCELHEHAVVRGPAKFGNANVFHSFCVVGGDPQDYTFHGEDVELEAGNEAAGSQGLFNRGAIRGRRAIVKVDR